MVPHRRGLGRNLDQFRHFFRRHAVVSPARHRVTVFYGPAGELLAATRPLTRDRWTVRPTGLRGNVRDGHNVACLGLDGTGRLHLAWDHHNHPLHYCRSRTPSSWDFGLPEAMVAADEDHVTYPEFLTLPGGDLLGLYRDGRSGDGALVLNRYETARQKWQRVHRHLIDGQGQRSPYWQAVVDPHGGLHLSWVWRRTPDAATNHDLAYAYSPDAGHTWRDATGRTLAPPFRASTCDYAARVPEGSDLINQTSMTVDPQGRPMIATYWREPGDSAPQFRLVYYDGAAWRVQRIGQRTLPFTLRGGGSKRLPVSRPLVLAGPDTRPPGAIVVYRDAERGGGITSAETSDVRTGQWVLRHLSSAAVGAWEPTPDPFAWSERGELHLFVQAVGQGDGETVEDRPASIAGILECRWHAPFTKNTEAIVG